jgi:molybdate transport system substrate-binding protein
MCARSMHVAVGAIARAFAEASGHEVDLDFGTVGALQAKLDAGERADVVILSRSAIDKLERDAELVPGSRRAAARTFIAVCVRAGAPHPDITTVEAFKRTLAAARAIALSDPAVGGSAGVYLAGLFERLGLAAMMKDKGLLQQSGAEVARRVVEGAADIGLTLSGEVASVAGAVVAGPLPAPFSQDTIYCAAIMAKCRDKDAANGFITALLRPQARQTWAKAGFAAP